MRTQERRSSEDRRKQIVKAVLRIIGDRGATSLTTRTLAEEVGVTSGALFRHYASQDEILADVVEYAVGQLEATFPDASLPPLERLLQLASNRVRVLGTDPGLAWLLRSEQARLMVPDPSAGRLRHVVRKSRRYLLDALREGASKGSIRNDIDPDVLLVLVTGTIHALIGMPGAHRFATSGRRRDQHRVIEALERILAPGHDAKRA